VNRSQRRKAGYRGRPYGADYSPGESAPRCSHDGSKLVVLTLDHHIQQLSDMNMRAELALVFGLREFFKLSDIVRICPECMCATGVDGAHPN
jgi:hypothetical protein